MQAVKLSRLHGRHCSFIRPSAIIRQNFSRHVEALSVAETAEEEARRANESLQEIDTPYTALAETAADSFVTLDTEGRTAGWNHSAERMLGHSREQIIGRSLLVIVPER